jgi:HxlR-like helix-turn-helix
MMILFSMYGKIEAQICGIMCLNEISEFFKFSIRLKKLQKNKILERRAFNEIPPRIEYRLTIKGQVLVESVDNLFQWLKKWSMIEPK